MTTLHRIILDPHHPTVREHVTRPHRFYGALMAATDGSGHGVGGDSRVLFRIERGDDTKSRVHVLVQTNGPISKPDVFTQYGDFELSSKPMLPAIQFLELDRVIRFSVRVNPVARKTINNPDGSKRVSYRIITGEEPVTDWFRHLAQGRGLEILDCVSTSEKSISGKTGNDSVNLYRIEGIAKVVDQQKAKDVLKNGIGRAKIFGCGLLTVAAA